MITCPAVPIDNLADASRPNHSFGVFIGINCYANLPGNNLKGCVNDCKSLQNLFSGNLKVDRYAMLLDGAASRNAILKVLTELVAQVRQARSALGADAQIRVAITYAGHGRRVKRLHPDAGNTEEDTWVAADSDFAASKDVRASELFPIFAALGESKAEVVVVADACQSGNGYRSLEKVRTILPLNGQVPDGPPEDHSLFAVNDSPAARGFTTLSRMALQTAFGTAWYAACRDQQFAYEGTDEHGAPCGRLSFVMRRVLEKGGRLSYDTLYSSIVSEFETQWRGDPQTPQYTPSPEFGRVEFWGSKIDQPHGSIIVENSGASPRPGTLRINMGSISGVSTEAQLLFYTGAGDFGQREKAVGVAPVVSVDLLECRAKPAPGAAIPPTAWVQLDAPRIREFKLAVDKIRPVPSELVAKIGELAANKQIDVVDMTAGASAVLYYDPTGRQVMLFNPTALPMPNLPIPPTLSGRAPIPYSGPAAITRVVNEILYVARAQRLMSLENTAGPLIDVTLVPVTLKNGAAANPTAPTTQPLSDGATFSLKVVNKTTNRQLFATVFGVDSAGNVQILYPDAGELPHQIGPGGTFVIGQIPPFTARFNAQFARDGVETTFIKIIATTDYVDYTSLMAPPELGARNVRSLPPPGGTASSYFDLVRDVLHGGALANAAARETTRALPVGWSTATIGYQIIPR